MSSNRSRYQKVHTRRYILRMMHLKVNHKLKFIQEPFCVYGYTNTRAHVPIDTHIYTQCVCVCVCIIYTTCKQV